jgi:thiol-disulfide isomerase/thioredoxin
VRACLFCLLLLPALLLIPAPVQGEEEAGPREAVGAKRPWYLRMMSPSEVVAAIPHQLRGLDRNQQWEARPKLAAEYLDAWMAAGYAAPRPEDVLALQALNSMARRFGDAAAAGLPLLLDTKAPAVYRAKAAETIANLLGQDEVQAAFGHDGILELAEVMERFALSDEAVQARVDRSRILYRLAAYHDLHGARGKVVDLNLEAARAAPGSAPLAGKAMLRGLMSETADLEAYPALREKAKARFDELRVLAQTYVEQTRRAGDATATAHAEAAVQKLMGLEAPLGRLGEPAADWTTVRAFGDVKSLAELEGKVVVLDFWATWCTWCIKSFPAIRDLARDYEGKDLVIVGVTTTGRSVVESSYDLDADMQHKARGGAKPLKIQRAAPGAVPDPTKGLYDAKAFEAKEIETLGKFISNHEMGWPVVMIDPDEPKAKYALQGWPHAVVIDRKGRIRYFKSGALLRDDPAKVKHFREVLDALLAEDAAEGR